MPTLAVARDFLFKLMGRSYTEAEFEDLCFSFGIELDDITSQRRMFIKEHADQLKDPAMQVKLAALSDEEMYKIDTPANRYDLLSAESMAIALRVFSGLMKRPVFRVAPPQLRMLVKPSVNNVRDFVVCAVLRNITFTEQSYASFIDFQDKLHSGLARKRTLASVGTHDLDKVRGPFTYELVPKADISFVPLNKTAVMHCAEDGLERYYEEDRHISKFIPIIKDLPAYPVVFDADRKIMSLPPIINSDFSKIDLSTKNVFIECTATDHHRASVLVTQLVSAFSMYCKEEFSVESVDVEYEDVSSISKALSCTTLHGRVETTPVLQDRRFELKVNATKSLVGVTDLDAQRCADLLEKMMLSASVTDPDTLSVMVPPSRCDILHSRDVAEDVAIAYGYDNIVMTPPLTLSQGSQAPINKMTHLLRLEVAAAGYTEMLTFSLCSRNDAFKSLGRTDTDVAVHIANPQTIEFQICRPSLLPGSLKTLAANKYQALPLKLFEINDVVLYDDQSRTGCRNERRFAALCCQTGTVSFEDIQGMAEYVLQKASVAQKHHYQSDEKMVEMGINTYYSFEPSDEDPAFFPGRGMKVLLTTFASDAAKRKVECIGGFGVVHPNALQAYDVVFPCSYCEISIQHLL